MTGILIQESMKNVRPKALQYSVVGILAVFSHGILDKLAKATYHPPGPLPHDWFWTLSHLTIALLTFYIVVKCWRGYWLCMFCSVLPDLDWLFRPFTSLFYGGAKGKPFLHNLLNQIINYLIPPSV